MLALRWAAVLALGLWIGGLVALGAFAAPAAFDVLGSRGAEGRALAGATFGEAFARFHVMAYGCGLVILVSLAARAVLGPRPRRFAPRLLVALLMLAAAAWSGLILLPQIDELQRAIGMSPALLPEGDARRGEFGRLHALSSALQAIPVLGGLGLLFFDLRD